MARTKTQGVEREPSGRISRKADVQQMSYSQIERMKRSIHLCAADPRHGSIVGLLNLSGQISDAQFRAANTIHTLRQAYVAVYGVPALNVKAINLGELRGASCNDPEILRDRALAYTRAMDRIGHGTAANEAITWVVFQDQQPGQWLDALKSGLTTLSKWFDGVK